MPCRSSHIAVPAQVGPESSGAHPGPVCYRKGGYAAITDANLVLGRIMPDFFPNIFGPNEDQPLHADAARNALEDLARQVNEGSPGQPAKSVDEVGALACPQSRILIDSCEFSSIPRTCIASSYAVISWIRASFAAGEKT